MNTKKISSAREAIRQTQASYNNAIKKVKRSVGVGLLVGAGILGSTLAFYDNAKGLEVLKSEMYKESIEERGRLMNKIMCKTYIMSEYKDKNSLPKSFYNEYSSLTNRLKVVDSKLEDITADVPDFKKRKLLNTTYSMATLFELMGFLGCAAVVGGAYLESRKFKKQLKNRSSNLAVLKYRDISKVK